MKNLISSMNKIIETQKEYWPEFFKENMSFSQDEKGVLCFNGLPIYAGDDLILETSEIELDRFSFYFNNNRFISINIIWEEDTLPAISSVVFGYLFNDSISDRIKEELS